MTTNQNTGLKNIRVEPSRDGFFPFQVLADHPTLGPIQLPHLNRVQAEAHAKMLTNASSRPELRRFERDDFYAFENARPLPSGAPLIAGDTRILAPGTDVNFSLVIACDDDQNFRVSLIGCEEDGGLVDLSVTVDFEADAIALANLVLEGRVSLTLFTTLASVATRR